MRRLIFILLAMIGVSQAQTIQYIGAPTTTVISRGNFRTDSIFYLPKRSKAPTDTAALRYQISDSTVYVWTGSQWVKAGGGVGSLTGSGVAGYMPEFTTTTNLDSTRLYHSAGRFAIGSTTTTNGVFNVYGGRAYFDTSLLVSNKFIFDEANTRLGIGTTAPIEDVEIYDSASDARIYFSGRNDAGQPSTPVAVGSIFGRNIRGNFLGTRINLSSSATAGHISFESAQSGTRSEVMRIDTTLRVGIGTTAPESKLHVVDGSGVGSTSIMQWSRGGGFGSTNLIQYYNTGGTDYGSNIGIEVSTSTNGRASIIFRGDAVAATGQLIFNTGNSERMRVNANGELIVSTAGTDAGDYKLQVVGNIYNTGSITTGAPSGGSIKPWKIGEAATVSPTSPNRTLRVEVDGVVYYIHAKTTND